MGKYAWTWNVKPECIDEYVAMHEAPWPEIMKAHSDAGIVNYSIFQNGTQFFYVYECEDPDAANRYLAENEDCKRWNAITSKMVEGSFDLGKDNAISYMKEVFYLP
ncbi:MAG: L-rhamnose mutarotase [Clostridiales Family XIII bacterium]|jgi:L-rhamnose mutarotase|nr:L-rhamnose mutarotase [Clostridiales Family XIII bacterium]